MRTLSIVIAYYSVPIYWLNSLLSKLKKYHVCIYIYYKGNVYPEGIDYLPKNVIQLDIIKRKNVGRNDETYLYHIQKHYNNLTDDLLFIKDSCLKDIHTTSSSGVSPKINVLVKMLKNLNKTDFSCNITDFTEGWKESDNMSSWKLNNWNPSHKQVKSNFIKASPRGLYNWTKFILSDITGRANDTRSKYIPILDRIAHYSDCYPVCYSGIFTVTRDGIQNNSKSTYTKLMKGLQNGDNLEAGHYVERLWGFLFSE